MHGSHSFDVIELVDYIRERRILFVISCSVAVLLALAVSLVLPKQYAAAAAALDGKAEGGAVNAQAADPQYDPTGERARLTRATHELKAFAAAHPIEPLDREVQEGFQAELQIDHDLTRASADLAAQNVRAESSPQDTASLRARIRALDDRRREMKAELATKAAELDARWNRYKELEDEVEAARSTYETRRSRLSVPIPMQVQRAQLQVEAEIVPQAAGFPNTPLNVTSAFVAAFTGTLVWLMLRFSYVQLQRERSERRYRVP